MKLAAYRILGEKYPEDEYNTTLINYYVSREKEQKENYLNEYKKAIAAWKAQIKELEQLLNKTGGARPGAGRAKVNDPKLKKIFNRVNGLAKLKIRAYALAFQEWNEAEAALIGIRDNAFKRMFEIAKEMGFSIKSREKMKDWLQKEEDEFAKFLFDN
ncbi:hypothetical protein [Lebetimonas sp. JS138]|uniref:hypothetical protein n=1 Tax=Lebetimonas sp. JS138 TaxID=990072 RepID=UPI000465E513|nr:hypothetical protein [Lebetimonas sp. JS138]